VEVDEYWQEGRENYVAAGDKLLGMELIEWTPRLTYDMYVTELAV
jgi:hypothetical protein